MSQNRNRALFMFMLDPTISPHADPLEASLLRAKSTSWGDVREEREGGSVTAQISALQADTQQSVNFCAWNLPYLFGVPIRTYAPRY